MLSLLPLIFALPYSALSNPIPQKTTGENPSACAQIQSALTPLPSLSPSVFGTVPAQLAWDCLQSIPLNVSAALELVKAVRPYMSFQSTVNYLADPPEEYADKLFPAVDIYGGLDRIESKLNSGDYNGEYEFGLELYTLIQSCHDGHFGLTPDSVGKVFTWGRTEPLVSVSNDGEEIPAIFLYRDILASTVDPSFKPSPVEEINGEDAVEYLLKFSTAGSLQDRDALWNNAFYSLAQVSLGPDGTGTGTWSGGGRGRIVYPGPVTALKFDNGTTATFENFARVLMDFSTIKTGQDIYDKHFVPVAEDMPIQLFNQTDPTAAIEKMKGFPGWPDESRPSTVIPKPGYPTAVQSFGSDIGGYYIDKAGYEDVAVLAMASFLGGDGSPEFQKTSRTFLAQARKDGKKKLVIDVSANGGGTIWLGYEIFLQLFPKIDPYGSNRFRAHQTWDVMGKIFSDFSAGKNRSMNLDDNSVDIVSSPMNFRSDINAETGKPFASWEEKYGPHEFDDMYSTTNQRWDLDDPFQSYYSGLDAITTRGLPALEDTFAAEDVVIVYDGYCASTCTIFSEFMRQQAGVETIALGGRPNTDIIQAVGGTKGTNNWSFSSIPYYVIEIFRMSSEAVQETYRNTEIATFNTWLPFHRVSGSPGFNMRDGTRKGDPSGVPLQFIVEPADCRLFYTPDMTVDVTAIWKAAADVKWSGKKQCVAGGFKNVPSSHADEKTKLTKRARKSKTATASSLGHHSVSAFHDSFHIMTDFVMPKWADGMMSP